MDCFYFAVKICSDPSYSYKGNLNKERKASLNNVTVHLQPIVSRINLPTVIKTAVLPGESFERLMVVTQPGIIYHIRNGAVGVFLDIRSRILTLGTYDERGLLGLAFHPDFTNNGLFYLHYSVAGSQGPGALPGSFRVDPCIQSTMNMAWTNRETRYDHIDTVQEWIYIPNSQPRLQRTLLNIRRPFLNHNGVNSLNFSPETGRLVLTTGDGGSGYDPFNLSQNNMEIAGKIIEIDVSMDVFLSDPPVVTRFDELPIPTRDALTVIAKGVRNIPGISYQVFDDYFIKYVGIVGQDMVESVYSFIDYQPIPVTDIIEAASSNGVPDPEGFINFGWRGWEGAFPTSLIRGCTDNPSLEEVTTAYYGDAIFTSTLRIPPLTCYYHIDPRPDKAEGTALTGVQAYNGRAIPALTGSVVFTDLARKENSLPPARGFLAYTWIRPDCKTNDYHLIDVEYEFSPASAFFTCLGSNLDQTRLFLGVYGSMNVSDLSQGTVFEIVP